MAYLAAIIVGILVAIVVLAWWFTRTVAQKAEAALPPKGKFTDVPGGRLHWVEKGEGQPVVMIHGLAGSHYNFTYAMLDQLADILLLTQEQLKLLIKELMPLD